MKRNVNWLGFAGVVTQMLLLLFAGVFVSASSSSYSRKIRAGEETASSSGVRLTKEENQVIVDNGILRVTFSVPGGMVLGIKYGGIDNVLDPEENSDQRGLEYFLARHVIFMCFDHCY
uniref:Uncharacterized protein n=1 Tax=Kalanchoe fedtschenkoi TaxID=63787 RepID=A0A7N0TNP8_KALFE